MPPPQDVAAYGLARTGVQDCVTALLQPPWRLQTVEVSLEGPADDRPGTAELQAVVVFYSRSDEFNVPAANLNSESQAFLSARVSLKPATGWNGFLYYPVDRLGENVASGITPQPRVHERHPQGDIALDPEHGPIANEAFQPFELYGGEDAILILPDRSAVCVERTPGLLVGGHQGPIIYCQYRPEGEAWGLDYQFPSQDPTLLPSLHQEFTDVAAKIGQCLDANRVSLHTTPRDGSSS